MKLLTRGLQLGKHFKREEIKTMIVQRALLKYLSLGPKARTLKALEIIELHGRWLSEQNSLTCFTCERPLHQKMMRLPSHGGDFNKFCTTVGFFPSLLSYLP